MMNNLLLKGYVKAKVALTSQKGSVLTEYGLLIALVVVGAIAVLTKIGTGIETHLDKINEALTPTTTP